MNYSLPSKRTNRPIHLDDIVFIWLIGGLIGLGLSVLIKNFLAM